VRIAALVGCDHAPVQQPARLRPHSLTEKKGGKKIKIVSLLALFLVEYSFSMNFQNFLPALAAFRHVGQVGNEEHALGLGVQVASEGNVAQSHVTQCR
jgi:hypothetical protein